MAATLAPDRTRQQWGSGTHDGEGPVAEDFYEPGGGDADLHRVGGRESGAIVEKLEEHRAAARVDDGGDRAPT